MMKGGDFLFLFILVWWIVFPKDAIAAAEQQRHLLLSFVPPKTCFSATGGNTLLNNVATARNSNPQVWIAVATRGRLKNCLVRNLATRVDNVHVSTGKTGNSITARTALIVPNKSKQEQQEEESAIPFVIERILDPPSEGVFKEISKLCIQAFFNDGPQDRKIPIWKEWQLSYLKNLQQGDLRTRRKRYPDTNMMFLARRVRPVTSDFPWARHYYPLILDLDQVCNLPTTNRGGNNNYNNDNEDGVDYYAGEVLGFVEVTLRPYGLGMSLFNGLDDLLLGGQQQQQFLSFNNNNNPRFENRPIVTNLCVQYEARQSGVGSRLMEFCERQVWKKWSRREVILEVEEDNHSALQFYLKRGFQKLYIDSAGRRYDTNGLFLRQRRCRHIVMRKELKDSHSFSFLGNKNNNKQSSLGDGNMAQLAVKTLQKIRDSFFQR